MRQAGDRRMSCDKCYKDCSLRDVCDREEKLPMTNWEKYFGTPEKAAEMLIHPWAEPELMVYTQKDGMNGFCIRFNDQHEFLEWLQEEAS